MSRDVENVSFKYPVADRYALKNINLSIAPGETIALVGEKGSGKTTLVKLLCRLYDPTSGRITLDNVDLRDFDPMELRQHIGVLFQDYTHYNLTARDNIWFGDIKSPLDSTGIQEAARLSDIDDEISNLKYGYKTMLGKWFEGGEELSIGEWQKLALARSYFRDAPIVILDEPTSAMDAIAEHDIISRFHQLVEGKIAILISHRLSTIKMADRIYVLEKNEIIESGSHDDLIKHGQKYAQMFETQALAYQ